MKVTTHQMVNQILQTGNRTQFADVPDVYSDGTSKTSLDRKTGKVVQRIIKQPYSTLAGSLIEAANNAK